MVDVNLDWQDNAVGETGYSVERREVVVPLAFQADWRNALGTDAPAITDGGKWNGPTFNAEGHLTVVAAAPALDFPIDMANVLRINLIGTSSVHQIRYLNSTLGELLVGQRRWWRMYFRNAMTTSFPSSRNHQPQMGDNVGLVANWLRYAPPPDGAAQNANFQFEFHDRRTTPEAHAWSLTPGGNVPDVENNRTYRLEWSLERTVGFSGIMRSRIYDDTNTLIHSPVDGADFGCVIHGGAHKQNEAVEDVGNGENMLWEDITGDSGWERCGGFGMYAPGEDYGTTPRYVYWGGFAVSNDDWCGAYRESERPIP